MSTTEQALKLVAESLKAREGGLSGTRWEISEEAAEAVRAAVDKKERVS